MKSVMKHDFSRAPSAEIPRSVFNRSCGLKTTFDAGYLVPIYVDEALPGDTHKLHATLLARMNTPVVPIMDNLWLETFFFAIPNRLVWENWERFCGAQDNPGDSIAYTVPTMTAPAGGGHAIGSLSDYFGLPTEINSFEHISLVHRCYNLIYNDWFKSQDLIDDVVVDTGDGPDDTTDYALLRRGKRHDYFTSALPWPQKGDAVEISLGTSAPVYGDGNSLGLTSDPGNDTFGLYQNSSTNLAAYTSAYNQALPHTTGAGSGASLNDAIGVVTSGASGLMADLSAATASNVNDLRESIQIQRFLERAARGGTRYKELILSMFNVRSDDARLDRPEYLGGSSTRIYITPVEQTSATDTNTSSDTPQGNLAAYGVTTDSFHGFTKSFTEHCYIIGLVNVRADLTYQQGCPRMFSRSTRYDYFWPAFSHLGEQPIYVKELYAQGDANDDTVFGYQEAYADYRYKPSQITGAMRSTATTNYDFWHLSEEFTTLPVLNETFINDDPPIDRIVAVNTEPDFLLDVYFDNRTARPMPMYSVPGLMDHF